MPQRVSLKRAERSAGQPRSPGRLLAGVSPALRAGRGARCGQRADGEAADRGRDSQEGSKHLPRALPTSQGRQGTCCLPAERTSPGASSLWGGLQGASARRAPPSPQHRTRCTYAHWRAKPY